MLSNNIHPNNYKLIIKPNFDKSTFSGFVKIHVLFDTLDDKFVLHSKNLFIQNISVTNMLNDNELKTMYDIDQSTNEVKIKFDNSNKHYEVIVNIWYEGVINTNLCGFYKSTYMDNDVEKYVYSTQMEPADCRQLMPCFDQPDMKATFDIAILMNKKYDYLKVFSNESIKSEKIIKDKYKLIIFNTTPIISSYLVCIVIGDYITKSKNTDGGVQINVNSVIKKYDLLDFSLNVASKCLDYLDNWFGTKYNLKKLDLVGIPSFSAGAMENYGCLTFRNETLLCDDSTELKKKQEICITVCHEISHLWFGDMVTIKWWNYLWLNEGFATWMSFYVTNKLFPEWNIWNKFINDDENNFALNIDSLKHSHPIETIIESADDINQIFDGISYSKGACIIRFIENFIGSEIFKKGLQEYIKIHLWKNTTSDDLWDVLSTVSKKNIKKITDCWIKQTGYPLLTVECIGNKIKLHQQRFFKSGKNIGDQKWIIPVKIIIDCYDDQSKECDELNVVLNNTDLVIPFENNDKPENIIVNPYRIGYYRVMYKNCMFNINNVSTSTQQQILTDCFATCFSGYNHFLDVFNYLIQLDLYSIDDYGIWNTIITHIMIMYKLLKNSDNKIEKKSIKNFITKYMLKQAQNLFSKIGFVDIEGEQLNNEQLRPLLISFLSTMKDMNVIETCKKMFAEKKYKYILQTVGKYATNDEYQQLIILLESNTNPQFKDDIIVGLSGTSNNILLDIMINEILSNKIRSEDISKTLHHLSSNKYATKKMWNYVKSNWKSLLETHKPGSSSLSHIIKSLSSGFCTYDVLNEYVDFFNEPPSGTQMIVNQMIESIECKILTIKRILESNDFLLTL